jgi:hypothetical protein
MNRLDHIDRQTAQPIRRLRAEPARGLVDIDVKKLGRIQPALGGSIFNRRERDVLPMLTAASPNFRGKTSRAYGDSPGRYPGRGTP